MNLDQLSKEVFIQEGGKRKFLEYIALCHMELSAASDEYLKHSLIEIRCDKWRHGCSKAVTETSCLDCIKAGESGEPNGIGIKLADCIIRVLNICGALNIDIEKFINVRHNIEL